MMPYVSSEKFKQLAKEAERNLSKIEYQYEKAVWYSRRHAMQFGADEEKLKIAIYEYYRKRDLQLDFHEKLVSKRWDWASLRYW